MKQHLMGNINTIARCAALYRDRQLEALQITGWQAPYLPQICGAPGITQDQLAARLHVNRSNVTRQLAMLEEKGFVRRQRSTNDRRAIEVYATERGYAALPAVKQAYAKWRELLFSGLQPQERELLEELLERLARRAEEIG